MHNETIDPSQQMPPYTDENRCGLLIGMILGFVWLTFVFVVARVYVRASLIKKWGADDTLIVVSWILTFITGTIFAITTRYGLGYHVWTIPTELQQSGRRQKMIISATLGYHLTFITIKMAFLLQFRRVFTVPKFRLICDIMFAFISCFGVAVIISSIVMSIPTWNGDTFAAERYNQAMWWIGTAIVHLVTDLIIFCMPIPMLHKLKLQRGPKIACLISFGLGFITTAISVVRMSTLPHIFTRDVTWDVIPALIWSFIELCCALMCACIPTLRPLLRALSKRTRYKSEWNSRESEGDTTRMARRPLKAVTLESQQSMPSPMLMDIDAEPKTPTTDEHRLEILVIRADLSPVLTAGESDDGSEVFGPVDEEVATPLTPLSPPPKSYTSPARLPPHGLTEPGSDGGSLRSWRSR
ncbi:hypothetical protein C8034_v002871 [Colletotrichum sidae]|uniref:Rhodopsin domain-containing protein n=1 Tax=Colletotrichum sidae TaxID=1347389 RepID=A0A4R8TUQ0_9PEZI|nr:hypothetical protein C8034_v002871 [Colletotrichum sidae]